MAITSKDIIDRYHEIQRERIHIELLKEAINGLADLKANKTLSLAQLKAQQGGKRFNQRTVLGAALKHKHLVLDQRKINAAKRYFGVVSEQEAIDKALSLLVEEQRLSKALRPLKGVLKGDERPWPYR